MRTNTATIPTLLLLILLTASCGPDLSTDGELKTRVSTLRDIMKCRHLGNVDVAVQPQLYPLGKETKMAEDLLVKARNLASEIGADTVVPADEISDGEQLFRLYICAVKSP